MFCYKNFPLVLILVLINFLPSESTVNHHLTNKIKIAIISFM